VAEASFSLHFLKAAVASGVQLTGVLPLRLGTNKALIGACAFEAPGMKRNPFADVGYL